MNWWSNPLNMDSFRNAIHNNSTCQWHKRNIQTEAMRLTENVDLTFWLSYLAIWLSTGGHPTDWCMTKGELLSLRISLGVENWIEDSPHAKSCKIMLLSFSADHPAYVRVEKPTAISWSRRLTNSVFSWEKYQRFTIIEDLSKLIDGVT